VARYIGRHGTSRVAKAVLIGAVPPIMIQTENNRWATAQRLRWHTLRGVDGSVRILPRIERPVLWSESFRREKPAGLPRFVLAAGHDGRVEAGVDCIKAFSETDFTDDLKKFDVPTLIIHGDDDQIVPINDSALLTAALVKGSKLKYIRGPARFMLDAQRPGERGSAGVPQELDHPANAGRPGQPGCKAWRTVVNREAPDERKGRDLF